MKIFNYPYVVGANGDRLRCQLRYKNQQGAETVYIFLMEATGDTYAIKKIDNEWIFVEGNLHLNNWIQELGNYIDNNNL